MIQSGVKSDEVERLKAEGCTCAWYRGFYWEREFDPFHHSCPVDHNDVRRSKSRRPSMPTILAGTAVATAGALLYQKRSEPMKEGWQKRLMIVAAITGAYLVRALSKDGKRADQ